jgi:hypothetical protein
VHGCIGQIRRKAARQGRTEALQSTLHTVTQLWDMSHEDHMETLYAVDMCEYCYSVCLMFGRFFTIIIVTVTLCSQRERLVVCLCLIGWNIWWMC